MRLIDADAYAEEMKKWQDKALEWYEKNKYDNDEERKYVRKATAILSFAEAKMTLDKMPTVDAVPVVRCEKCKHGYDDIGGRRCTIGPCVDTIVYDDFFCKNGEREENNDS